jgi:hypothetical protein
VELTKQHKVLLGVVGAGVLLVAGDRLLLGGEGVSPRTAAGAAAAKVPAAEKASEQIAAVDSPTAADRLLAFADKHGTPSADSRLIATAFDDEHVLAPAATAADVFEQRASAMCAGRDANDAEGRTRHFREQIKLTSVMLNPKPMAFLAGEKLEVGETMRFGAKAGGSCEHQVKLLRVHGPDRQARRAGSAEVLIDGTYRVELVIER